MKIFTDKIHSIYWFTALFYFG